LCIVPRFWSQSSHPQAVMLSEVRRQPNEVERLP
jgi:hypothetical protein